MAIRKHMYGEANTQVYKMPTFAKESKMNFYDLFSDPKRENKPRVGFYNTISFSDDAKKLMTVFTVTAEYEYRLDLIAFKCYGTTTRDWMIEAANDLKDNVKDIVAGRQLLIPSEMEIYSLIG
jgi:hypothetical protein